MCKRETFSGNGMRQTGIQRILHWIGNYFIINKSNIFSKGCLIMMDIQII